MGVDTRTRCDRRRFASRCSRADEDVTHDREPASIGHSKIGLQAKANLWSATSNFLSLASFRAFRSRARLGGLRRRRRSSTRLPRLSAISVRRLEQQIGVTLFVRHPNQVVLTESGEIVAKEAITAFAALRASFARAVDVDETRLSHHGAAWRWARVG